MELTNEQIAQLLKKPDGDAGKQIALKMNEGNAKLISAAIENLDIIDSCNILEIGFGNGKHLSEILSKANNLKYTGIDFSETMVQEANELNQHLINSNISFEFGDISKLNFDDNSFDRIITVNTIYFWPNPMESINELYRVLKPGGTLIIGLRPSSSLKAFPFTKHGFEYYDPEDLKALFQNAKFTKHSFTEKNEGSVEFFGEKFEILGLIAKAVK